MLPNRGNSLIDSQLPEKVVMFSLGLKKEKGTNGELMIDAVEEFGPWFSSKRN